MAQLFASLLIGAATFSFAATSTAATTHSRATYDARLEHASADQKVARDKCDALSGNAKDVCVEEAKAVEKRAKAAAKAQYKHTRKARTDARIAAADADYAVANAKCGAKAGNDKDVCVAQAKAMHTKAVADAKSSKKIADARAEARSDTRDADYKVAVGKCDALSGAAKDSCVDEAKAKFIK